MKIFLTGGTGFIGSHFINQAQAAGHEIRAVRRSPESKPRVPLQKDPEWLEIGLEKIAVEDFEGCEVLVHFAAAGVTPQPASWNKCFSVNVLQTLSLFQVAKEAGINRFVVSGTYAEYGKSGYRYDPIPVSAPLEPTDIYASSKACSCIALCTYSIHEKIMLYYGRIFSAYGEGQYEKNFWPSLKENVRLGKDFSMTEGEQVRDFIPVEQVAEKFLQACNRKDLEAGKPCIENIGTGKPQSLRQFAEKWWGHWEAKGSLKIGEIPYRENEVMRYVPEV